MVSTDSTFCCFNLNFADIWRAGLTEEQITEIFSGAGRVLNFRLVYDRETGRPKGFGFAEFPDYGAFLFFFLSMKTHHLLTQPIITDSAASAVRNLNDYEIMGRKLRVDFSNETGTVNEDDGRDRDGAVCHSQNKQKLPTPN